MPIVEKWFPTTIYQELNLFDHDQNELWKQYALEIEKTTQSGGIEWEGGTYTTHDSKYDIQKDPRFGPLIDAVTNHVYNYVRMHNSKQEYSCDTTWINISRENNFQEMHTHNESTISAVYYISAPPGSGKLVFEDPREPDMLPIKNISVRNELSFVKVGYEAQEGSLIIFRSYLRHMVTVGTNTDPRISVAFNF
jgi:uncharacterized protein (TIGR02466 family)